MKQNLSMADIVTKRIRLQNRKKLFEMNREVKKYLQEENDRFTQRNIIQPYQPKTQEDYVDPQYRNIINAFINVRYKPSKVLALIEKMPCDNIFNTYELIIGLSNMGSSIINPENELDILGSGIIFQLSKIFFKQEHTFLQLRAAMICLKLLDRVNSQRLHIYFNSATMPFQSILFLLKCQSFLINWKGLQIIRNLQNNSNNNCQMLDLIGGLIKKFRERETIEGLSMISGILRNLKIVISHERLVSVNKYYSILTSLLEFFESRKRYSDVIGIIRMANEKIRKICNIIKQVKVESKRVKYNYQGLFQFVSFIINLPYITKSTDNYNSQLNVFYSAFMVRHESSFLMPKEMFIEKLQACLAEQAKDFNSVDSITTCLQLYANILKPTSKNVCYLTLLQQRESFFDILSQLFEIKERRLVKQLQNIVGAIIQADCSAKIFNYLESKRFLSKYVKSCAYYGSNNLFLKTGFTNLKLALFRLKKNFPQSPLNQKVAKIILQPDNYELIQQLLINNYKGAEQVLNFFEKMRSEYMSKNSLQMENKNSTKESKFKLRYEENIIELDD